MMKIFIISNYLKRGGKEKQIVELISGLSEIKNYKIYLILREDIVEYLEINNYLYKKFILSKSILDSILKLRKIINKEKPDIIHTWEGVVNLITIISCAFKKNIIINGSIRYAKKFNTFSKDNIINKFNFIFSKINVANSLNGLLLQGLRQNEKNLIIYNGVDYKKINQNSGFEKYLKFDYTVGMVANFNKSKDFMTLIYSGVDLLNKGYSVGFIFVGDGSRKNLIANSIPEKFRDHFLFTGLIKNVDEIIIKFDIGVLISLKGHAEGISNSIMEYMSNQKPVIATNIGGNPEIVSDGLSGFLIEAENIAQLTYYLELLINDSKMRRKMGLEGEKIIKSKFSKENMIKMYDNLYKKIS